MRYSQERDAELHAVGVHDLLDLHTDSTGALVQNGIAGAMVVETSHGDSLLVTSGQGITPLALTVPTTLTLDNVVQLDDLENLLEVLVGVAVGLHVLHRVGVNDLVAEGSEREIGALGDIEDVLGVRAM